MKAWNYNEPRPEDYDSLEEYERALAAYDAALDQYLQECADSRFYRL